MGWTYKSTNKIGGHHLVEILTLMDLHQNLGMTRNSCGLSHFHIFSWGHWPKKPHSLGETTRILGDRTAKRVSPWIKLPKSSVQAWLTKCSWAHRKKKHWGKAKIWNRKPWFLPEIMLRGLVSVALRNSRNSSNLMFVPWNSQKRPAKSMISFGTPFPCVSHH
jgi:hypothetical protein